MDCIAGALGLRHERIGKPMSASSAVALARPMSALASGAYRPAPQGNLASLEMSTAVAAAARARGAQPQRYAISTIALRSMGTRHALAHCGACARAADGCPPFPWRMALPPAIGALTGISARFSLSVEMIVAR